MSTRAGTTAGTGSERAERSPRTRDPERAGSEGPGVRIHGPERLAAQGITPQQEESAHRAIRALLTDPGVGEQVDLVITYRRAPGEGEEPGAHGAYEVWSRRGLLRFQRVLEPDGQLAYRVLEVVGENPIESQDPAALRSVAEEGEAARASGFAAGDPHKRFIGHSHQSYPFAYERIAQLFDSPHAPDLVISPEDWTFGVQLGQHGALNVRQSRAPLWLCGRRLRPGVHDLAARAVDIAPTALAALDFPLVDGADASGLSASERGVAPDVYLHRQDGRVLEEILDFSAKPPKRLYIFLLDGLHHSELEDRLARDPEALPALRALRRRAAVLASGSIVNFPSITWPSHTAIGTGSWCGHHDVVNPSYYLRERREQVSPQGQQVHTEGFSSRAVESLYEAFRRVRGAASFSAAIHAPFGRGADHAVLEGRNLGRRERLKALTAELVRDESPRWRDEGVVDVADESRLDSRGLAQVIELFTREDGPVPDIVYHELALTDGAGHHYGPHSAGLAEALDESDRRLGRVLALLEEQGLLDETLFVVTADHGMAPQDVTLHANPARHVERMGMAAVVAEPMIWLRDLAVEVERAPDGRTGRVCVREDDPDESGEQPEVLGAAVRIEIHGRPGEPGGRTLCQGATGAGGVYGFATPADLDSSLLVAVIEASGFNPRRIRFDGTPSALDLRRALYADA